MVNVGGLQEENWGKGDFFKKVKRGKDALRGVIQQIPSSRCIGTETRNDNGCGSCKGVNLEFIRVMFWIPHRGAE